jgi:hypothetical protein
MSMTDKKTYKSEFEAWKWVHEMFPGTQWYLDHESSERAGYKTYRDTEEFYNYVCELGDRLEVNLKEGNRTINLWIEKEEPEIKPETYKIEFNDVELILVKGALYRLSTTFNELDVVNGNSNTLNASITCLELIKRINGVLNEKN